MVGQKDITVAIFGKEYTLRSATEPSVVRELAVQVDKRMREAAAGCGSVSADRLAVLVALNLADDLTRALSDNGMSQQATNRRLGALITMLAEEVGK